MAVSEAEIVNRIIKKHGEVIDLNQQPDVVIEILRVFGPLLEDDEDGGLPPGGTPPSPPGPTAMGLEVTLSDVMHELLKLSQQVAELGTRLGS
jgi:hypothetical protein